MAIAIIAYWLPLRAVLAEPRYFNPIIKSAEARR
jgi:hypothetical protein